MKEKQKKSKEKKEKKKEKKVKEKPKKPEKPKKEKADKKKKEQREKKELEKKLARQQKKAVKDMMVDESFIDHLWNLVTLWPRITDPELEERLANFTIKAKPDEYLHMQQLIFDFATPLLEQDWRFVKIMKELDGKQVCMKIPGDYSSVVTLKDMKFTIKRGNKTTIPGISAVSREVYRDAILKRADPVHLFLQRKIRLHHPLTIVKWALPYLKILRDRSLYDKVLSYQPDLEKLLNKELTALGY